MELLSRLKKVFKKEPKIYPRLNRFAVDFYAMRTFYNERSNNIAVIDNQKAFKHLVKDFTKRMAKFKSRQDQKIKINDNKYVFIIDDIETTIFHINSPDELYDQRIEVGRYI